MGEGMAGRKREPGNVGEILAMGLCVLAVTAVPMSAALTDKLRGKMEQVTGKKVELKCSVDPSIMGGIVVKVNNEQFDTSLRTRLEELAARLTGTQESR